MKHNWLYVIVIVAVTLSVWGGLPTQKAEAAACAWNGSTGTAWDD